MIQSRINLFNVAIAAVLLQAMVTPTRAIAQGVVSREAELKGKLVGVLGKLVTWPATNSPTTRNPFTVGILGPDPFVDESGVNHLQNKVGLSAKIKHYAKVDDIEDCHILVVAREADFQAALAMADGNPILVIAESAGLAKQGAAMNLVYDATQNRIRLEINPKAASHAGLKINSGLLNSPLVDIVR